MNIILIFQHNFHNPTEQYKYYFKATNTIQNSDLIPQSFQHLGLYAAHSRGGRLFALFIFLPSRVNKKWTEIT